MFLTHKTFLRKLSNHELCHSTSKPIGNEENILKSFMVFDITPCKPVFRVVVGSQIVIPPIEANTFNPQETSQPHSQANHAKETVPHTPQCRKYLLRQAHETHVSLTCGSCGILMSVRHGFHEPISNKIFFPNDTLLTQTIRLTIFRF